MTRKSELRNYKNRHLMNEFNEMMIRIKAHLFEFNDLKTSDKISPDDFPKPTEKELDDVSNKIMNVLMQDSKPIRT